MSKEPNWLDRGMARLLSGQIPVVLVLAASAVAALFAARKAGGDEYLQACAIEVSVGSLFFLALYLFRIYKFTPRAAITLLSGGAASGLLGWLFSQAQVFPLTRAVLLELASAAILFIVIELVLRGMLLAAEQRNAALAKAFQDSREQAIEQLRDASLAAATAVVCAIDATRRREDIEEEVRAHWNPDIPEPLFRPEDGAVEWSMTGILGWAQPQGAAGALDSPRN